VLHAAERFDGSRDRKDPVRQRHKNALIDKRRELGKNWMLLQKGCSPSLLLE
jgi:hypothetical protein